jgi:hypothetical protein
VPLAANALVSLETAKDFLRLTGDSDDARLEALINRASYLCETWCCRPLKQKTLTNVRMIGPCTCRLPLLAVPVKTDAAVTVSVDAVGQTVWRTEADGDPGTFDVILASYHPEGVRGPDHLYRAAGWAGGAAQPYNVVLTYTGGFATVPDDVQQGCLYIVQRLFRDLQKQLTDVVTVSTAAGGVTLVDTALPRVVEIILTPYRLAAVAA